MNGNPEGTPNPLNPNPAPAPMPTPTPGSAPVSEQVVEVLTEEVTVGPATMPGDPVVAPVASTEEPAMPASPDSIVEPAKGKKKKTGWIVAAIVALLVAAGCAVAAILILNPFGGNDQVSAAITKLLKGEAPKNISLVGSVNVNFNEEDTVPQAMKIDFDINAATQLKTGDMSGSIALTLPGEEELLFSVGGMLIENGDLYLKIADLSESLNEMMDNYLMKCDVDTEDEYNKCYDEASETVSGIEVALDIIEPIDGDWIRVPGEYLNMSSVGMLNQETQCLVNLANGISQSGNSIAEFYKQNSFVTSSTDNISITAKSGKIYRLGIDENKLQGFASSISGLAAFKNFTNCIGGGSGAEVDMDDIKSLVADLPTMYAEIDDDNNFTRIYVNLAFEGDVATGTLDIAISYPEKIEVSEPEEYIGIDELFMMLNNLNTTPDDIRVEDCDGEECFNL